MKIKQVSVAWCVRFFEKGFIERWKLDSYNNIEDPCFFLGLEQTERINKHKGVKIIYPISEYDCSFLHQLEFSEDIFFVKSPYLPSDLPYKVKDVEIELKNYSMFKPNTLGDKIYCYIGQNCRSDEFNLELIKSIQKQINYEIVYTIFEDLEEYLSIEKLKEIYYDKCFLSLNFSHGTGMTTVRELGLMGRKTITNSPYNFPSMIKYKNENEIIEIINEEAKKIGTIQPSIDCHNVKDEWLDLEFWLGYNKLELVECSEEYWEFVRLLRMDSRVVDGFIKNSEITKDQQIEYMSKYSNNYRISLYDGFPAGYIGVIDDDIRICTHPDYQNKGVGKFMVRTAKEIWPNAYAKVKPNNDRSKRLFESCGFKLKYFIYETDET